MEHECDSLTEEGPRLTKEKAEAVQFASNLKDDFDIGVEETRRAVAMECRKATEAENVSLRITFSFLNSLFLPLDRAEPLGGGDEEHVNFE